MCIYYFYIASSWHPSFRFHMPAYMYAYAGISLIFLDNHGSLLLLGVPRVSCQSPERVLLHGPSICCQPGILSRHQPFFRLSMPTFQPIAHFSNTLKIARPPSNQGQGSYSVSDFYCRARDRKYQTMGKQTRRSFFSAKIQIVQDLGGFAGSMERRRMVHQFSHDLYTTP